MRTSWDRDFRDYVVNNILVTQRLLQAVRGSRANGFVFASSSSVYGNGPELPTSERALPLPVSPYGTTKLAAEHLCRLYAETYAIPAVSLGYFTVYGARRSKRLWVFKPEWPVEAGLRAQVDSFR